MPSQTSSPACSANPGTDRPLYSARARARRRSARCAMIRFLMSVDPPVAAAPNMDALIERCLKGDQAAWDQIVRQHWRKVFNLAYKFVGRHDEAEDLTQDIFLKVFKALHTFDRRANFQTWLISISRNLCIDHYRSVRKERETMARDVDASQLMPVSRERSPHGELEQIGRGSCRERVEV